MLFSHYFTYIRRGFAVRNFKLTGLSAYKSRHSYHINMINRLYSGEGQKDGNKEKNQNMGSPVTSSEGDKTEDRNDVKLTANIKTEAKSNSEENINELSVTIPGLTKIALGKRWNECELLLKKSLVLGCPEIKQLQYCKPYDDVIDKAVEKGFVDLIKLLIHNGYPCDTVLHYALKYYYPLEYNREDLIYLLIKKGADVNCKVSDRETPLLIFTRKCSYEVMQLLISKGADVNCKGYGGETPLLLSVQKCSCKVVQLLLFNGADINVKNSSNESVLHIAAKHGNYDVVKFLLDDINDGNTSEKIRNDINLRNIHGESALHLSVKNKHYNVAELLLDRGADIDLKDDDGCTALHICCTHKKGSHLKIFNLLYERHANINERGDFDETPLIVAVKSGNTSIVKCLLNDPYCDVNAESYGRNILGTVYKTARDYARISFNSEIIDLIETRLSSR